MGVNHLVLDVTDRERAREIAGQYRHCFQRTGLADELAVDIASALAAVRAETVEQAALAAKEFGENHKVVTKKRDGSRQTRFSAYDVDYHIKAACNFVAEDIRSLKTGDTNV